MGKARSALADDKLQKLSCCGFILAYCLITNHYIFISGSTGTTVGIKNGESSSEWSSVLFFHRNQVQLD
jgi:hypothetical protein